MKDKNIEINDLVYFDNLKIVQNKEYFKFSLDSVLLPSFCLLNYTTKKILDLCTGNAPVPLILSTKTKEKIECVEYQEDIYEMAKESIHINGLDNQIKVYHDNAKNVTSYLEHDTYDLITCNPPYFKVNEDSIVNDNNVKSLARHELTIKLDDIIKIGKVLLKNGGSICLVHRTDRLIEIIDTMKKNNIELKRIRFVYPKEGKESNLVLIDGHKNGRSGLKILPPLYVHKNDGTYTEEVLSMFGGK